MIDLSDDDSGLEDDITITVLPRKGSIALEKTGEILDLDGNGSDDVGEVIMYSFTVTNTGLIPLTNIIIIDDILPGVTVSGGPIDLLPGESDATTFTASYIITEADIEALLVINQATVLGNDPEGNEVTDLSDDPTDLTDIDPNGDGNPDDPTVIMISGVITAADIEVFNGISADGDSINDAFIIENIELFPENTVQIFNRWGVQVFETTGYNNFDASNIRRFVGVSDGRATISKGDHLPTGTYYYIITYAADDGVTRNKSGYLYLNR